MISQRERARLMEQFKDDPVMTRILVLKCVAGLLILSGLAVIGVGTELPADNVTASQAYRQRNALNPLASEPVQQQAVVESVPRRTTIDISSAHAAEPLRLDSAGLTVRAEQFSTQGKD